MDIIEMFNMANKGDVQLLESLKKALSDNSYKHCYISAEMMLDEMEEMGLDSEAVTTYLIVASKNLPYSPADII
tara:strand:- start:731 stop:952 length:222 start_codon:yes stop_codon:yes gene_type:complete